MGDFMESHFGQVGQSDVEEKGKNSLVSFVDKEAEKMLILIAERAINKMTYVSEDDRLDCLQFAILDLLKYWRNFNPKYPNAFAYFTEIAKRGYAKGWNKIHPKKYKGTLSLGNHSGSSEGQTGIYSI